MNKEIQDELNEIAPALAKLPRTNAFSVPAMYFNSLPHKIIEVAQAEEMALEEPQLSPALLQLKKSKPFQVPEGYFTAAASTVIQKIRTEEVHEEVAALAPALAAFEKKNPFTVPANYFSSLPARVLSKVQIEETSAESKAGWLDAINGVLDKLIAPVLNPRLAYVFATIFAVAMMMWLGLQEHDIATNTEAELAAQLQSISAEEVRNYIAMNIDEFDEATLSKNVSEKKSLMFIDDALLEDELFQLELLKELDEEYLYNNLEASKNGLI